MALAPWPGFCLVAILAAFLPPENLRERQVKRWLERERFTGSLTTCGETAVYGKMTLRGLT
jgi:hypothetical protein